MSAYTYTTTRRRYVIRQLSNLARRARRIRLSKNGTPKIARPEDAELATGIQRFADTIERYASQIQTNHHE